MCSSTGCARRAAALAVFLLAAASSPAEIRKGEAVSLEVLLARFRSMPGLEANFREVKKLALLKAPLVSEGTIHFAPPDRLARRTATPAVSTLVVDSRQVRFSDAFGSQSIPLEQNPVVRLFVDAFLKVLAGDREALERIFTIELRGTDKEWTLVLHPRIAPMTEVIDRIVFEGRGGAVGAMNIREVGGDETATSFSSVNVERRFTAGEKASIFGGPAP
jgi:hypothetical protein